MAGWSLSDADLSAALLAAIPDAVGIVRRDGQVVYVQVPGKRRDLLGEKDRWDGANITKLLSPPAVEIWMGRIGHCIESDVLVTADLELDIQGLVQTWEIRMTRYSEDHALVLARDVTEVRRKERERDAAVELTGKMEAVGELAASIAHDFNNLLTAMSLNISYLEGVLGTAHSGAREVSELMMSVSKATVLTRHLLSFSQRAPQAKRPMELRAVVTEVLPFLRMLAGPSVTIRSQLEGDPLWVLAEPTHIEQLLIILASNSTDAMPSGGRLDVALSPSDGRVSLRVEDTGPGIGVEERERVFEPFYSTKIDGLGTGLGLAAARRIVNELGGRIAVVDGSGKGACFEISLPLTTQDAEPVLTSARPKILVVEDEPTLRRLIADLLVAEGYAVECAAEPAAALALAQSFEPELVLCDVMLPQMSGIELASRLRETGTEVAYLTGSTENEELDGPRLNKPFTPAQLRAAVAGWLNRRD